MNENLNKNIKKGALLVPLSLIGILASNTVVEAYDYATASTYSINATTAYGYRKTTANINLYSERGSGTLLTVLSKGTIITLQESSSVSHTWIKVYDTNTNQIGYVNRSYLTSTSELPVTTAYGYRKTTAGINLYSERGAGTLLTVLSKGTVVSLQEPSSVSHNWIKVYDSNTKKIGYVNRAYLTSTTETPGQTSTRDAQIEKVIELSKKQLGKKYVYGTAGPNTFDCSGFTSYVYKNSINVTIPRTSSQQASTGQYVSLSNLKRGDLIIFGNKSTGSVNHVAIYLGNNQYIHAPQTGDVVKIVSTSSSHFTGKAMYGRRII